MNNLDAILSTIARDHLSVPTLKTHHSDSLDFYDVAVWQLKVALNAAFDAGLRSASTNPQSHGQEGGLTTLKPSPMPWSYEYSPYRVQRGTDDIESELPAFEVFDNGGNKVFDTNEDAPTEQQEANAQVAVIASQMAELLQAFIRANKMATECAEWKWENLEPLFQRAHDLVGKIVA